MGKGYVEVEGGFATQGRPQRKPSPPRRKPRKKADGPPDWTTTEAWQAVFNLIKPHSRGVRNFPFTPPEELDSFEAQLGFKFPASYRAFTQVFGRDVLSGRSKLFVPNARTSGSGTSRTRSGYSSRRTTTTTSRIGTRSWSRSSG